MDRWAVKMGWGIEYATVCTEMPGNILLKGGFQVGTCWNNGRELIRVVYNTSWG